MRVYLDSVGCKLNQSEIEKYAAQFHRAGHEMVAHVEDADIYVLNTCAVTAAASSDSRQKLRQAVHQNPEIQIIATGCLVSLDQSIQQVIPQITRLVPNDQKDTLVQDLLGELPDLEYYERQAIPGSRQRTRAFIKVQDGCDNFCTFCVTRLARGVSRSMDSRQVLNDIQGALAGGAREVVLTGVHLASYGMELTPKSSLADLISAILKEVPENVRIRVSSLEPWDMTPEFFDLWEDPRLCPHFHLPLQSGSDAVLRRMARKIHTGDYVSLVEAILTKLPDAAITTDVIVGFPGETEAEFMESLAFIQRIPFAGGHVFSYSVREKTAAARMHGQVHGSIKKARSKILREVFNGQAERYHARFVGKNVQVLWESARKVAGGYLLSGLTPNYVRVDALNPQAFHNQYSVVSVEKADVRCCWGTIVTPARRE